MKEWFCGSPDANARLAQRTHIICDAVPCEFEGEGEGEGAHIRSNTAPRREVGAAGRSLTQSQRTHPPKTSTVFGLLPSLSNGPPCCARKLPTGLPSEWSVVHSLPRPHEEPSSTTDWPNVRQAAAKHGLPTSTCTAVAQLVPCPPPCLLLFANSVACLNMHVQILIHIPYHDQCSFNRRI